MTPENETLRDAIALKAGYWYVAHRTGDMDAASQAEFHAWLVESPLHIQEYLGVSEADQSLRRALGRPADSALADKPAARHPEVETRERRRWLPILSGVIAAAALVGVAVGVLLWNRAGDRFGPEAIYRARHGEHLSFELADHTFVQLNADSEAHVRFSRHERVVELLRGEGLFEVAHESGRRFRVQSGEAAVIDLGTRFDVKQNRDQSTVVTVIEGTVGVYNGSAGVRDGSAVGAERLRRLEKGEQVVVRPNQPVGQPVNVDLAGVAAWVDGKIAFEKRPLAEVIDEFNRFSDVPLVIEGAELGGVRISGIFDANDIESFTDFLRTLDGVAIERADNHIRVYRRAAPSR